MQKMVKNNSRLEFLDQELDKKFLQIDSSNMFIFQHLNDNDHMCHP